MKFLKMEKSETGKPIIVIEDNFLWRKWTMRYLLLMVPEAASDFYWVAVFCALRVYSIRFGSKSCESFCDSNDILCFSDNQPSF